MVLALKGLTGRSGGTHVSPWCWCWNRVSPEHCGSLLGILPFNQQHFLRPEELEEQAGHRSCSGGTKDDEHGIPRPQGSSGPS